MNSPFPFSGWLVLDKPLGMTSSQAVGKVKRLLNLKKKDKIGHAGTLDPLASGVLPLAVGEATKTVQYCMGDLKRYRFKVVWGRETDSGDLEGRVVAENSTRPPKGGLNAITGQFTGHIKQTPPIYSAIKVDGERAYALARAGEEVELPEREVFIESLVVTDASDDWAEFEVKCGKGTYVRSLAVDIARALGTVGHVSELRRLSVGKFDEKSAISLEMLEEMVHKDALARLLHPVESVLDDIPAREISPALATRLRHGQALPFHNDPAHSLQERISVYSDGKLVALCDVDQGTMKPVRVFNL